jgi:hypothetical protein
VYQVHIRVADNAARNNGLVELYLDDEPTPVIRVTNADMSGASGPAYTETAVWTSGNGSGKLTATLFSTNKNSSQVHPEAYMWIDDVVISRERVPALGTTTPPVTPPPTPTGVQVD